MRSEKAGSVDKRWELSGISDGIDSDTPGYRKLYQPAIRGIRESGNQGIKESKNRGMGEWRSAQQSRGIGYEGGSFNSVFRIAYGAWIRCDDGTNAGDGEQLVYNSANEYE